MKLFCVLKYTNLSISVLTYVIQSIASSDALKMKRLGDKYRRKECPFYFGNVIKFFNIATNLQDSRS